MPVTSGLGVTSTSGIRCRSRSRLRCLWCWVVERAATVVPAVTWATGGKVIFIGLQTEASWAIAQQNFNWCTNRKSRLRFRWCELGPRRVAQADVRPWTWGMASPDGCSLTAGGLPSQLILRDLQVVRSDDWMKTVKDERVEGALQRESLQWNASIWRDSKIRTTSGTRVADEAASGVKVRGESKSLTRAKRPQGRSAIRELTICCSPLWSTGERPDAAVWKPPSLEIRTRTRAEDTDAALSGLTSRWAHEKSVKVTQNCVEIGEWFQPWHVIHTHSVTNVTVCQGGNVGVVRSH